MNIFIYGDNVDTDAIIPARYLYTSVPSELSRYCFIDFDENYSKAAQNGDIIFAGENFGCGSSREHAPLAIKESGISAVVAKSFARIFYRNAINIGLPILECPAAVSAVRPDSTVSLDLASGEIIVDGTRFSAAPMPDFIRRIISAGGLLESIARGGSHA